MEQVYQILTGIKSHPALENKFYEIWMRERLHAGGLATFVRNYQEWVQSFPDTLALLVAATDDIEAKVEYAKTLYSELGYGNPTKAHATLLQSFFSELADRLDEGEILKPDRLRREIGILPSTAALIEGERSLYSHVNRRLAVGAQLALEWQAYTMLRKLYEGACNYMDLWSDRDAFHEAYEYFYVHIGAAEKDHKDESLKAVIKYAPDGKGIDEVARGYCRHLELIAGFWNGIHSTIMAQTSRHRPN